MARWKVRPRRVAVFEALFTQRGRSDEPTDRQREKEFQAFDAALDRAVRFRAPQVVTVVAPLGLGKTRLLAEWLAEIRGPGVRVVRVSLSVPGMVAAGDGNLIGALLRQRFGITPQMGPGAALVQFRSEMERVFADRRRASGPGADPPADPSPPVPAPSMSPTEEDAVR